MDLRRCMLPNLIEIGLDADEANALISHVVKSVPGLWWNEDENEPLNLADRMQGGDGENDHGNENGGGDMIVADVPAPNTTQKGKGKSGIGRSRGRTAGKGG